MVSQDVTTREEEGKSPQKKKQVVAPDYTRQVDVNTNNFPVHEPTVQALIQARNLARTQQDFGKADAILAELVADHGVVVNDSHRTWLTATKKQLKKLPRQALPKVLVRYRPDYELCPYAGPHTSTLTEPEIQEAIAARREAQKTRDFDQADRIRSDLKAAGVYLEDGRKEWRADGVPFRSSTANQRGQQSSSSSSRTVKLVQSDYSLDVPSEADQERIESLLARRSQSKSAGHYDEADEIRDRLFETYNIRIDDRLGEWSVGGDFGVDDDDSHWASRGQMRQPHLATYVKSPTSEDLPTDEEYIQQKVEERMRAKRTRNYDLSDAIRDELLADYDVTIHDKINQWSIGGDFGSQSWKHVGAVQYVPKETDILTAEEIATVDAMIAQRGQAKRDRDLKKADKILRYLSKTFAVAIDDKSREWYCKAKKVEEEAEVDASSSTKLEEMEVDSRITSLPAATETEEAPDPCISSREELSGLTVVELKERLRDSGKKVSGKKEELIERLLLA